MIYRALVVSEEDLPALEQRAAAPKVWLVDPLDNTRGLVNRKIETCGINIAFVEAGAPTVGYLHYFEPARGILGIAGEGAFEIDERDIRRLNPSEVPPELRYVAYRGAVADMSPTTRAAHEKLGIADTRLVHRELLPQRLRAVMLGEADVYLEPRPLHEWDIAPAIAVITAMPGTVRSLADWNPITFNSEKLVAPPFVAMRAGVDAEPLVGRLRGVM
jgi:3'-phosphoadenosine 5'-phosphosulfate (PAPS) 3'-phosphatase